jgi:CrcB protein
MARLLWVCLAGALGTGVRYLTALAAARLFGTTFPWGTLVVNVVGCFLMSIVAYAGAKHLVSPGMRTVLATGFMGGLTTYSAFNWDTLAYAQDRAWGTGFLNLGATLVACMVAGVLGLVCARAWLGG